MTTPLTPPVAPAKGFDLDKRQAIGLAIGLVGLGVLIGFKLAHGDPLVIEKPVERIVFRTAPCADCEEAKIKAACEGNQFTQPEQSVPGDSSIPE